MDYASDEHSETTWVEVSAATVPAILGAAAGMFLGDLMCRSARRGIALGLAITGVVALTPYLVGGVVKKVNSPQTRRGSRRTLAGIRNAGIGGVDPESYGESVYIP
jgi:hypothetical protein